MTTTILVIEDDQNTVKMIRLVLEREGYHVLSATNGFQGLKLAADGPDLVLLDLMLPGVDGFEVLSRLRTNPQTTDIPVVILSAKDHPSDKQTASKIGANAYLKKPYSPMELVKLLGSFVEPKSA